ncbi:MULTISPECIES: ABC transporter substrate-binding protein [unclassified Streptomyces]|uniref:ABC transporter substrate-binding protein n=1 Tax=unclassified Streptomyces TaxID=2593676 RepID=UPI002E80C171|nr:ABC transporter substrate-binding protein [Streptomyces sp. NBC_00589]WTI33900.1 ABC transporter substrate-binding protein [Streptomyces sp. NBC_00775]WUB32427.1 ABC transporter substrate-binding protein [Streptomyces sp. NBC_00589]
MRHHTSARTLALTSAAVLGAALLTGCGGDSSSVGSDGKTTVSVGISGNIFDLSIRVAEEKGYFAQQNIKVKYVTLTASTGTSALESSSVQFLNDSPTNFLSALSKGLPELAIGTNGGGNPLGLVASDEFAKKHNLTAGTPAAEVAKALADSTAGASSANTKAEAGLFLKANGVDPTKLKWVSLPSPAADKAALTKGEIDWFVTSEPIPLQVQHDGDGMVVADPLKVPQWSYEDAGYGQLVVVKKSYANSNAATVQGFATAVQQATAYIAAHKDDTTVLSVARKTMTGASDDVLKASIAQVEWPKDDRLTDAGMNKTIAFVKSIGAVPDAKAATTDWTNKYLP